MALTAGRSFGTLLVVTALLGVQTQAATAAKPACRGKRATIVGRAGDDHLTGTDGRDVIVGLGGDDLIESLGGADVVCGGGGDDEIYSAGGNDTLVGGAGSDVLVADVGNDVLLSGGGSDYLNGGAGDDKISAGRPGFDYADFRTAGGPVTVDLASGRATGDGNDEVSGVEMIAGSEFDDRLSGASGDFELFLGLGGDDEISGREGFDQLIFEESDAPVSADVAAGTASGEGSDTFTSIESIVGTHFDDVLRGHDGSDDIYALEGNDVVDGRGGNDYLLGHAGDDEMSGGPGEYDMIDFDQAAPALTIDLVAGTSSGDGADEVSGFEIIGGSGFGDTLKGDDGDQLFYPYAGDDSVDGGGGSDLVLYNLVGGPVTADLATGIATGEGADSLTAIEGFVGSAFADSLSGDASANVLIGGPGNDSLAGRDGDDYMDGGAGNDAIDGGPGTFDMSDYFAASKGVEADLAAGTSSGYGRDSLAGIEALLGSPFADVLSGDDGANYLFGAGGVDVLDGRGGTDDCSAGETVVACEGDAPAPPSEDVQRLQELLGVLSDVVGRGP